MKIYCQKCGKGSDFSAEKPKFCASCGNSFVPLKAAELLSKIVKPKFRFDDNKIQREDKKEDKRDASSESELEDDDYDPDYEFPEGFSLANITKLDVEMEKPSIALIKIYVDPTLNKIRVNE